MLLLLVDQINKITKFGLVPFSILNISFVLYFAGLYLKKNRERLISEIKHNKKIFSILMIILIFALTVRLFLPHYHKMYTDEELYLTAANHLAHFQSIGSYWKSIGWPILITPFYFFSSKSYPALYLSAILGALTSLAIFGLTKRITKRYDCALISALMFSLMPLSLRWSANAETNTASVFFTSLSILVMLIFYEKPTKLNALLSLSILSFTSLIRIENYILFSLFLIGLPIFKPKLNKRKKINLTKTNERINYTELIILTSMFAILTIPNAVNVLRMQFSENWTTLQPSPDPVKADISIKNIIANVKFFLPNLLNQKKDYPPVINLMFISGLILLLVKCKREGLFLILVFLSFLLAYLPTWAYIAGGRSRFLLTFYPMIVVSSAYALSITFTTIAKCTKEEIKALVLSIILLFIFVPFTSSARSNLEMNNIKYETILINDLTNYKNCTFILNNPEIVSAVSTKARTVRLQWFLRHKQRISNESCFIFVQDLGCDQEVEPENDKYCLYIKQDYLLKRIKKYSPKDVDLDLSIFKIIKIKNKTNS